MLWIVITFVAIALSYVLLIRPHKYWLKRGVKQRKTAFLFGESWGTFWRTQSFADLVQMSYDISPNSRYCGIYQFYMPIFVLRDPDLIKQITVKDFDHFLNHQSFIPEDTDPLWSKNLFALNDQKWRDMRSTLSPCFTSSKMKYMFSLISESGEQFVEYFLNQNKDVITVEMKDTFTRFTNDVIANTAFGVKCDSLRERLNDFYVMGRDATDFSSLWKNLKMFGFLLMPQVLKYFNMTLFSKEVSSFFRRVVKENMESREKLGIVRPDMIHLLMEARKHGVNHDETQEIQDTGFATVKESDVLSKHSQSHAPVKLELTHDDITAQALIFFFGGFDSVSSLMCFMSYELAINPDVQEILIREIDDVLEKCKGKLTYEALMEMKYLDMVISETLRLWPNAVASDRICTKPYTIEPELPGEKPVHISKNTVVWIPIYALHRDPNYFPNPNKFDPERFNDENKTSIQPYTYLPFGAGPRNCIGSRFALLETKVLYFYILSHFEIVPVEKTQIPLVLNRKGFNMTAENGFWFGLKRRVK